MDCQTGRILRFKPGTNLIPSERSSGMSAFDHCASLLQFVRTGHGPSGAICRELSLIFGYQSQTPPLDHEYTEMIPRKAMQNHSPVLKTLSTLLISSRCSLG